MKKISKLLICLILCLTIIGCGSKSSNNTNNNTDNSNIDNSNKNDSEPAESKEVLDTGINFYAEKIHTFTEGKSIDGTTITLNEDGTFLKIRAEERVCSEFCGDGGRMDYTGTYKIEEDKLILHITKQVSYQTPNNDPIDETESYIITSTNEFKKDDLIFKKK